MSTWEGAPLSTEFSCGELRCTSSVTIRSGVDDFGCLVLGDLPAGEQRPIELLQGFGRELVQVVQVHLQGLVLHIDQDVELVFLIAQRIRQILGLLADGPNQVGVFLLMKEAFLPFAIPFSKLLGLT